MKHADSRRSGTMFFAGMILAVLTAAQAWGGFPPLRYQGGVEFTQTVQTTLSIFQDGKQHYMIQPGYYVLRSDLPSIPKVCFVLALPEVIGECTVFSDSVLVSTWNWLSELGTRGRNARVMPVTSNYLDARYEVTTLAGMPELLHWLDSNDFDPLPEETVAGYHGAGWIFAAVLVTPPPGRRGLPTGAMLRPVVASFRADRVIMPILLSQANGVFHTISFIASADPIIPTDALASGMVPFEAEACRSRIDEILWESAAPESSRAIGWRAFRAENSDSSTAGSSTTDSVASPSRTSPRDVMVEWRSEWLAELVSDWQTDILNRPVRFGLGPADPGLGNIDTAPELLRAYYYLVTAAEGRRRNILHVSALCSPAMNTPDSRTDLRHHRSDPQMRLRVSGMDLPPFPPTVEQSVQTNGYEPPDFSLLPMPEDVARAFQSFRTAQNTRELDRAAREALQLCRNYPRIVFPDSLPTNSLISGPARRWPSHEPRTARSRNALAFQRSFRRLSNTIRAVWFFAQHTGDRPNRIELICRMDVAASGAARSIELDGNLPERCIEPMQNALMLSLRFLPARADGVFDFPIVIEGRVQRAGAVLPRTH